MEENKCIYCSGDSEERNILKSENGEWYLAVPTSPWSCEFVFDIKYCPYCGRELPKTTRYTITHKVIEEYEIDAESENEAKKLFLENKAKLSSRKETSNFDEKGE